MSDADIEALKHETWGTKIESDEIRILELLVNSGLAESNGEAKKLLQQNAISVNEEKVTDMWKIYTKQDSTNWILLLKRGKKYKIAQF
jgi:tyrosyl-tRNA synthetase